MGSAAGCEASNLQYPSRTYIEIDVCESEEGETEAIEGLQGGRQRDAGIMGGRQRGGGSMGGR